MGKILMRLRCETFGSSSYILWVSSEIILHKIKNLRTSEHMTKLTKPHGRLKSRNLSYNWYLLVFSEDRHYRPSSWLIIYNNNAKWTEIPGNYWQSSHSHWADVTPLTGSTSTRTILAVAPQTQLGQCVPVQWWLDRSSK